MPPKFKRTFFANIGDRDVILLDGADLLGRMAWRRFRRRAERAAGLVVACHREGLLPTLIECTTDLLLLDEILDELVPDEAQALHDTAHALFLEHGGNIREVLRSLYAMCARGTLLSPGS